MTRVIEPLTTKPQAAIRVRLCGRAALEQIHLTRRMHESFWCGADIDWTGARRRAGPTGAGGLERRMMQSASRSVFVGAFHSARESESGRHLDDTRNSVAR